MDGADGVYPSSEDTFLLIDALESDVPQLTEAVEHIGFCLEVGCGSGQVTATLSSLLQHSMCFSTDVNILAAQKTQKLITSQECHNVNLLLCDLFSAFRPGFVFDVIVFNPPYVPTDNEEMQRALEQRDIAASWAGGKNGREVIDNFLANVGSFLRKGGLLYLVVLQANKPNELVVHGKRLGMIATTILIRKAGVETLHVLRFKKC